MSLGRSCIGLGLWIVAALSLAGCSVEKCKQGDVGCVDGPVRANGSCEADLIAQGGRCVRPKDRVSVTGDASLPDSCEPCEKGLICASDRGECVDFCVAPSVLPGSEPIDRILCGGEAKPGGGTYKLDFDAVCKSRCLLECRRGEWFCNTKCLAKDCDAPGVLERCHSDCDKDKDPLACLQTKCSDVRGNGCLELTAGFCPGDARPDCTNVLCANSCRSFVFDGVCDDGDTKTAQTASCPYGSDCADCGPRTVDQRDLESELTLGTSCAFHEQCSGYDSNFTKTTAFCAPVAAGSQNKRCLRSCSKDDDRCPLNTECRTLTKTVDGKLSPLVDAGNVDAKACVPTICKAD